MIKIDPQNIPTADLHQYLLGSVSPRPICFASTIDAEGNPNLAPYSFFNVFSSNPPIAIFSSNRRVRDNTTKDTLHNIETTKEVVINVVNYDIVQQMTLASIEYPSTVNEFEKAGFTALKSELIKPFRVKESPVQMECKVKQIIPLGDSGGAGNLIICEVVLMHINEAILDDEKRIDPHKIDLMGRMGRAFYCRASGDAVMKIHRPVNQLGIGIDALPENVKMSKFLTGNELAQIGGLLAFPQNKEIEEAKNETNHLLLSDENREEIIHKKAKSHIRNGQAGKALAILMSF